MYNDTLDSILQHSNVRIEIFMESIYLHNSPPEDVRIITDMFSDILSTVRVGLRSDHV